MLKEETEHLEALNDIRNMMRKSSRFLSLSGLSGICAGVYALAGYWAATLFIHNEMGGLYAERSDSKWYEAYLFFIFDAVCVLGLSLITAYLFSSRKAKKSGAKLFDHTAWRLFWQMFIPLSVGGILSLALLAHGFVAFIAPTMLCFYGVALFSASKLTYDDVKYLGLAQITLGVISAFDLGNGLFYWAIGFGIFHIVYGAIMWWKHDRKGN